MSETNETKTCANCKVAFVIDADDFDFYNKIKVPPPTFCPECRAIRRMVFWNQSNLFKKKEARDGRLIFSTYPEEANIKIYDHDYWWGDLWNPMEYAKEIDFSKPFFEQIKELNSSVPWPSLSVRGMVDSDYCNQASYQKNCYLCFNGGHSESCLYCIGFSGIKDTMDIYAGIGLELCYEIYQGGDSFQCFFCFNIGNCRNVWFSRDVIDCNDCFGCVNLRHKKYYIFNQPYSKEDYFKELKKINTGSYKEVKKIMEKREELQMRLPHKYMTGTRNVNASGDYVYFSKNAIYCFEAGKLENVSYSENLANNIKDSYDYTNWGENSELIYESVSCGDNCRNIKFCFDCWPAMQDSEYCFNCHSSSNLFGCVGLTKKQYCILNKQYSKEEYRDLREKIIDHMKSVPYIDSRDRTYAYGEFFPIEFSALAYNETAAMEYYPKSKEQALLGGYSWRDINPKEYKITLVVAELPDDIKDVTNDILKEIVQCESCKRAYRIVDRELEFYRRFSLPLPRLCHRCRYEARLATRNPRVLHERNCQCSGYMSANGMYKNLSKHAHGEIRCPNIFETTYAPDRPEIVYCESCYNAEVV